MLSKQMGRTTPFLMKKTAGKTRRERIIHSLHVNITFVYLALNMYLPFDL